MDLAMAMAMAMAIIMAIITAIIMAIIQLTAAGMVCHGITVADVDWTD